jgi:hypothetical protein
MPRKKGTGTKSKLSVSVDTNIVMKLDERFGNSPGEKSRFVNWILADNLDNYLLMLDKVGPIKKVKPVITGPEEPEGIVIETVKSRRNLSKS